MREEVNERRRTASPGGREIEITIGGAVSDDDFDRLGGGDAPKTPGGIYNRDTLRWKRESFTQEDAAYTRQLLRDAEELENQPEQSQPHRRQTKDHLTLLAEWSRERLASLAAFANDSLDKLKKLGTTLAEGISTAKESCDQAQFGETAAEAQKQPTELKAESAQPAASAKAIPTVPAATAVTPTAVSSEPQAAPAPAKETIAPALLSAAEEDKPADVPAQAENTPPKAGRKAIAIAAAVVVVLCGILAIILPNDDQPQPAVPPAASWSDIAVVSLSDSVPAFPGSAYNCNFTFPEDERVLEIADGLMGNQLFVRHTMDAEHYDISAIDWEIQAKDSPNTFQLYLQALNPMTYLIRACELTGDTAYLTRAEQFILSWNEYQRAEGGSRRNTFLWNDHGTAMRAENLIYYYFAAEENGCLSEDTARFIVDTLTAHAEFLYDDANYTENHNHGIFQDRALIYIAYFLNDENFGRWTERALSRLEQQKSFAFTEEMVHVENSPHYHNDVTETLRTAARFLISVGNDYGKQLYSSLERSTEFLAYIVKPNGHLAEIGDTDTSAESAARTVDEYWAAPGSEQQSGDDGSAVFYPVSGYYIYRADRDSREPELSTWSMFKSGYSSGTHKHADDNSFMLYTAGSDVFVDPGYYNYMQGDRYSDYFASAAAHNTVVVDGGSYSPTAENSHLTGICAHTDGENYDYVLGVNDMYAGVSHDRHFYNLGEAIIIHDDITADESHTYSQLFHLSETAEIISQDDSEVLIKLGDTGKFVRIRQFSTPCQLSVINGASEGAQLGFISRKLNSLDTIDTLKFDLTGEDVSFITLITIENRRGKVDGVRRIEYADGSFTIKPSLFAEEYIIELHQRERIDPAAVTYEQKSSIFTFINQNRIDGLEFAWEILSGENGNVIYSADYSADPTLRYEFTRGGVYMVRALVRDGTLERRAVIAAVSVDTNSCTDITGQYPCLELRYHGHSFTDNGGGAHTFRVDFDYSWDYSIRWYIYRNGAYFDTVTTSGSQLDYTFAQPGKYTVMYYLRTAGGGNELWNFPEITVE